VSARRAWRAAAAALLLSVALPSAARTAQEKREGTVRWVIDGDTFQLDGGERVRLIGVDSPEHQPWKGNVEPYGAEASAYAKHILTGRRVRLEGDRQGSDRYGRTLAYVYLEDGSFFNQTLVEEGYAKAKHYAPNGRHRRTLAEAQGRARRSHRGLWDSES